MSDTEEMLIATRSRRSNAGNKMQKLLEQERKEMKERTAVLDDDEINLLFQEDEDDEEFTVDNKRKRDEDEEFSESNDESEEEEDEEAGERELQRQEKKKRKLAQKKKVPVIKKRQKEEAPSKPQYDQPSAESLLLKTRRTSKRSSVVANKLQVYEKLSQAEKKRKEIQERIRKHKQKQAEVEITQEDRLREAEETERINLLSLNKFKEQEISKKQTRMALHQRKKMDFKPGEMVIRILTTDWLINPLMEVEDREYWEQQLAKRHKKKKKYTRRKKGKTEGEEVNNVTSEDDKAINKSENVHEKKPNGIENSPDGENVSESRNLTQDGALPESQITITGQQPSEPVKDVITPIGSTKNAIPNHLESPSVNSQIDERINSSDTAGTEGNSATEGTNSKNTIQEEIKGTWEEIDGVHTEYDKIQRQPNSTSGKVITSMEELEEIGEKDPLLSCESDDVIGASPSNEKLDVEDRHHVESKKSTSFTEGSEHPPIKSEHDGDQNVQKQVSFASRDEIVLIDANVPPDRISPVTEHSADADHIKSEMEETPETDDPAEEKAVEFLEGPQQLVGRNFVTLYTYPEETPMVHDVRTYLFGPQWSRPLNSRSQEVELVAKITNNDRGMAWTDVINSPLIPDYSVLDKFSGFGEYDKTPSTEVVEETNKELELDIKTEAPTGVFFPNGVRKKCLITNRECQYFDPKNGVPYADVEAYKTIQELQDPIGEDGTTESPHPRFKWFGFARGGIYLDIQQRAANGVPEGFS